MADTALESLRITPFWDLSINFLKGLGSFCGGGGVCLYHVQGIGSEKCGEELLCLYIL